MGFLIFLNRMMVFFKLMPLPTVPPARTTLRVALVPSSASTTATAKAKVPGLESGQMDHYRAHTPPC